MTQTMTIAHAEAELLGSSRTARDLGDTVKRIAELDSNVLVSGEAGVGKELIARSLHRHSERRRGPFVALSVSGVPHPMLEAELFGVVRGHNGALRDRTGLLAIADQGTLFLDDIHELPPNIQAKLNRALQERVIRPAGAPRERAIDVRIVSASTTVLTQALESGRFSSELYYRIAGLVLDVPPLRERREDISFMATHFVESARERFERDVALADDATRALENWRWPGNLRELQSCIDKAVEASSGPYITLNDLPASLRKQSTTSDVTVTIGDMQPLEVVERAHIVAVLGRVHGNKARAASVLGIGRKTLYRKLAAWGMMSPHDAESAAD
jgi:two-component system, NtrC family, response regulator HydG